MSISATDTTVELTEDQKKNYNSFLLMAKELLGKQDHEEALRHYQRAYQLHPSSKLEAKITKLMNALSIELPAEYTQLQPVSDNKRPCPLTPPRGREKRRSPPLSESHGDDKENRNTIVEQTNDEGSDELPVDLPSLLTRAKEAIKEGNVSFGLLCYKKAYVIQPSETLERRMHRMQTYLDEQGSNSPKQEEDNSSLSEDGAQASNNGFTKEKSVPAESECISEHSNTAALSTPIETAVLSTPIETAVSSSPLRKPSTSADHNNSSTHSEVNFSEEQIAIYNSLLTQAKVEVRAENLQEALYMYEQAYNIHPTVQLLSKINKLKSTEKIDVTEKGTDQQDIEAHYTQLVTKGRQLVEQNDLQGALCTYQDAYGVKPSEKLQRKINKIKEYMQQSASDPLGSTSSSRDGQIRESTASSSADSVADEETYNQYVKTAKQHVADGNVKKALTAYNAAAQIFPSAKLTARIKKCKEFLESSEDADEADFSLVGNGFYLHKDLYSKLYPHQKEGLLWLWGLHRRKRGGILADDMGLGKTIQVIAFLSGLFDAEQLKTVIIVMPLSLIENWRREFDKWAPGIQVKVYHGGSTRERAKCTAKIQRRGGVLLTSYGMIVSAAELLAKKDGESFGREFTYDYVILDEGHKIKNPTKTSKGVHMIAANHRIILTGTPIQNNLKEMWSLFDWTHHGMLLGTARTFQLEYNKPITRAREKCATYGERRLGEQMADSLKCIIAPFLLRRTKAEVKADTKARGTDGTVMDGPEMPNLTRKNDFVVWCYLSELQKNIYQSFSEQDEIKQLLNTSRSPLTALVVLKKICDHPRLMSANQCHKLGLFTPEELRGTEEEALKECAANTIKSIADDILLEESGKLQFLVQLVGKLKEEGHRTLIFSMSRKMLDIIQKVLTNKGHNIMRMDGTITDLSEREKCVSSFQNSDVYDIFLLTTQVGGVGLTLTAADRVVIFDPSWNPATDTQAVDRAFRIGQQKNVCIYRFISCATIEEKIYRRQIFKDSVNRQAMQKEDKNLFRYFSKTELHELFQLDNTSISRTQQQLDTMHAHQRVTDTALDEHIAFLYSCEMFGLSDHDLMFSKEDEEVDGEENVEYIEGRVNKAIELLSKESELQAKLNEEEGKYVPAHLNVRPKISAKPLINAEDLDGASSERLFPEYNYGAAANLTSPNDWRKHAHDDSDITEINSSTPLTTGNTNRSYTVEGHDGSQANTEINSPGGPASQGAASSAYVSHLSEAPAQTSNVSLFSNSAQDVMLDESGLDKNDQPHTPKQKTTDDPQAHTSYHTMDDPQANMSYHTMDRSEANMSHNTIDDLEANTSYHTMDRSKANASDHTAGDPQANMSYHTMDDPQASTSHHTMDRSEANMSQHRIDDQEANTSYRTMDRSKANTSDHTAGDPQANMSDHKMDDPQANTSHQAMDDSEAYQNRDDLKASASHQITNGASNRSADQFSDDDIIAGDSDDPDSLYENSVEQIEESQSGSMLGDDFGHLHDDYVVKDSDEEDVVVVSPSKHKRRSTVLPLPDIDWSDEEEMAEENY